ncbi:MAG: hypothetical protein GY730_08260 [bacterium]|nr:hypothetical protein [bacterium]
MRKIIAAIVNNTPDKPRYNPIFQWDKKILIQKQKPGWMSFIIRRLYHIYL